MSASLPVGSRVALVAPAGPLGSPAELAQSVANAIALGWEPVVGQFANAREGYFAGADGDRLHDFAWALDDPTIDGIWCVRGGYGAMRLLPALDVSRVAFAGKPLIGFSDITALHALWQRAGVVSYHGPTARAPLTEYSRRWLTAALQSDAPLEFASTGIDSVTTGVARGRLVGGNLALLAALSGTPWQFDMRDAIVVIEDIGEAVYRLDRMLVQLRLAGAFDGCAGIIFGQFTNCPEQTEDGARSLRSVIDETAMAAGVPVVANAPFGHITEQWTLPLGELAELDAASCTLTIDRQQGRVTG
jgi:muramoyltetrapeptide carboxypeptidase